MSDIMYGFIDYYATLVQPSLGMVSFLTNEIGNLSSAHVLDAACGGGELAHALAVSGSVVTAVESEQALLKNAKAYSMKDKVPRALQFESAPLLELPGKPGSYHVMLCLNNASSALKDESEYQSFFKQAATLLNKGGRLVMQLFNYDMLLDYKVRELPDLVNEETGIRVQRKLRLRNDGYLCMQTELSLLRIDAKELTKQEIVIYPIRRLQIQKMLQDAGFVVVDFYGSVEGTTWQEDSPSTLFLAIRG
jgi:SAM-dependent methyltransferase